MHKAAAILAFAFASSAVSAYGAEVPAWAYPLNPPGAGGQAAKDDGTVFHVPDSSIGMTREQIAGRDTVPDWHPEDHPAMPVIVSKGRDAVRACAYCHQPTGVGRPENSALAGLSEGYIKQQVTNFKLGNRKGSEPRRVPQNLMGTIAANVSDAEIAEAAKYFASLKYTSFLKVVESDMVPKTMVTGGMMAKAPDGGMEAIGSRIIEVPEDTERAELRDSRTAFIAYVPAGSLKRGETLVAQSQCTSCHGYDMHGSGDVPRIAGRSPSYLVRQLYDIQHGKRSGGVAPMQQVINQYELDDMIAVAAYIASRE